MWELFRLLRNSGVKYVWFVYNLHGHKSFPQKSVVSLKNKIIIVNNKKLAFHFLGIKPSSSLL